MRETPHGRWWWAGVGWSLAALTLALVAGTLVPVAAETSQVPLLRAMARHAGYLYAGALVMALIGWIDSFMLYRRSLHVPLTRRPQA